MNSKEMYKGTIVSEDGIVTTLHVLNIRAFYRNLFLVVFIGLLILSGCKKNPTDPSFDSLVEELEYLTDQYVKMGAAIGIINKNQQQLEYYYGPLSNHNSSPPSEHSVFEIGSITKSFTTTLLAQMILDGKISLQDEVEPLLPYGEVRMPIWLSTWIHKQV